MTFQRARRNDQKAERRAGILLIARELCNEFGVPDWSLNELGRRADITKSNLYHYFSNREEILMHLMHEETAGFAKAFARRTKNKSLSTTELCSLMTELYYKRPLLCDLLCISASVLEKNVNLQSIRELKLASTEHHQTIVSAIESSVKGVDKTIAGQFAFDSGVTVMGLWPMSRPTSPLHKIAVTQGLEHLALDFRKDLKRMLEIQLSGLITKN